ncbi:NADPH:quinone reductase [Pseudocyphellaria aurata]|nr:NADPH:quinone reductase [Pseudocyphellaria aurata]
MSSASDIPKTMKGVLIEKTGGTEVLQYRTNLPVPKPKDDEILVRNEYIGVNYIDTYFRSGLYPSPKPEILGREASGRIVSLGPSASSSSFSQGDRVVWIGEASYAEYSVVPASKTTKIPDGIPTDTACAAYLQGLTALTLVEEAHRVERGDWVLVLAASGGVGGWLCQILRAKAARTIAVVGSQAKVEVARDAGADVVLVEGKDDVVSAVKKKTGGEGVRVVFDGVGKDTFERGLECVARKGSMISFGNASGAVPPFPIAKLAAKNAKVARPTLFNYIATREELDHYTSRLFDLFHRDKDHLFTVRIHEVYLLSDVARAHTDIESRKTMGKLLLRP